ncbi:MAG: 3-hydroxyacyl-CoA dehydrogenase family protein [Myxococcales bacterium]|nr:3-hydroxyacyl-CoA dehydrogenase family protein [Myxococcales bacterium]
MSETGQSKVISTVDAIKRVAVLGAGTMGHGIAQVAAMAGFEVVMRDLEEDFLAAAMKKIAANLEKGVARGKVSAEDKEATLARLSTTTQIAQACEGAQLVIEAVPESIELKREIFAAVVEAAPVGAILATNTSSLSIADIAKSIPLPERVVGMHFFNPVHIMKLVEVVKHEGTSDDVVQCARDIAAKLGKTGITVKDTPGFASSRLGLVIGLEAMRMFEQGVASAEDIDTAMKLGYGHPMGPLALTDLVGLDVRLSIAKYLTETVSKAFSPPQVLQDLVADGKLGKKTGEGFYVWKDGKRF